MPEYFLCVGGCADGERLPSRQGDFMRVPKRQSISNMTALGVTPSNVTEDVEVYVKKTFATGQSVWIPENQSEFTTIDSLLLNYKPPKEKPDDR